ncbi:nitrogen permease regulator 2 [Dendryphion nanum]|uniref:Nitrogen permease regulator 2 n=1 Tax=Dendryphion nanum TaxID=256645 RepID=A0A9P9IWN1_9PLEO|nr:nitrogen permease regulator 2 [Dendryphion nanum]
MKRVRSSAEHNLNFSVAHPIFSNANFRPGSRVLHQVPEGSITPSTSPSSLPQPLIPFDSVSPYLIPTQQFCDRLLTFCVNHHRVIGYPVCIREGRYSRNEFIFNFSIVIEEGSSGKGNSGGNGGEWQAYGEVARKMGSLLRGLEEQGGFLSGEEEEWGVWEDEGLGFGGGGYGGWGRKAGGIGEGSKVYALCEMILEDLNNYAECMIPIDDSNTINLKLFPTHPPPPPISASQVPLLTISLHSLTAPISSDLTLMRIIPYINGIHSVAHIAALADTDLSLTRKALQHLIYYGCLVLLDIFSFGAVYAPTADIGGFVCDRGVQEECARYVRVPSLANIHKPSSSVRMGSDTDSHDLDPDRSSSIASDAISTTSTTTTSTLPTSEFDTSTSPLPPNPSHSSISPTHPSPETLITLYTSLRQGLPLRTFIHTHLSLLPGIDIRRLITFGVIKGFLYRIHKYAILTSPLLSHPPAPPTSLKSGIVSSATSIAAEDGNSGLHHHSLHHKASIASTLTSHTITQNSTTMTTNEPITRLDSIVSDINLPQRGAGGGGLAASRDGAGGGGGAGGGLPLVKFLDGMHCFDEICIELGMSEKDVEKKIRGVGEVNIFYR